MQVMESRLRSTKKSEGLVQNSADNLIFPPSFPSTIDAAYFDLLYHRIESYHPSSQMSSIFFLSSTWCFKIITLSLFYILVMNNSFFNFE